MPGSREHEVDKIFPEVIKGAVRIAADYDLQVIVACSANFEENIFHNSVFSKNFKVVKGFTYDLMKYSKIGIIKSGTSTLEAGIFGLPMVIVYKTSILTYLIGKSLVKVDNIGMANIISGEKIVPELIQNGVNADSVYSECKKILSDNTLYVKIKDKLSQLKAKLGSAGASGRAAKIIYSMLNEA